MMRAFGIVAKTALVLILTFASNHGLYERFGDFIANHSYV